MIEIIQEFGYLGVFITIFVEIAFMVFPLPGDTLLFATGILTDSGIMNYYVLLFVAFLASTISGHIGYLIGTKISKETLIDNKYYRFKAEYIHRTESFFEKYGIYAIIFSRFVPIVRNFISQILGILNYDKQKFFLANLLASIIWPLVIISMGRFLGKMFPNLIKYAEIGIILVFCILIIPIILEIISKKRARN